MGAGPSADEGPALERGAGRIGAADGAGLRVRRLGPVSPGPAGRRAQAGRNLLQRFPPATALPRPDTRRLGCPAADGSGRVLLCPMPDPAGRSPAGQSGTDAAGTGAGAGITEDPVRGPGKRLREVSYVACSNCIGTLFGRDDEQCGLKPSYYETLEDTKTKCGSL